MPVEPIFARGILNVRNNYSKCGYSIKLFIEIDGKQEIEAGDTFLRKHIFGQ